MADLSKLGVVARLAPTPAEASSNLEAAEIFGPPPYAASNRIKRPQYPLPQGRRRRDGRSSRRTGRGSSPRVTPDFMNVPRHRRTGPVAACRVVGKVLAAYESSIPRSGSYLADTLLAHPPPALQACCASEGDSGLYDAQPTGSYPHTRCDTAGTLPDAMGLCRPFKVIGLY
jgi:hypothetical protein